MITEALLFIVGLLLDGVLAVLPGIPDAFRTALEGVSDFLASAGIQAGPFNKIFPLFESSVFAVMWLTVVLPASFIYDIALWSYRNLPMSLGGKG